MSLRLMLFTILDVLIPLVKGKTPLENKVLVLTLISPALAFLKCRKKITLGVKLMLLAWIWGVAVAVRKHTALLGSSYRYNGLIEKILFLMNTVQSSEMDEREAQLSLTLMAIVATVVSLMKSNPTGNPDFLPHYIVQHVPFTLYKFLSSHGFWKLFWLFCFLAQGWKIVKTEVRGGLIGLGASLLFFLARIDRKLIRKNAGWFAAGLLAVPFAAYALYKKGWFKRIARSETVQTRIEMAKAFWPMFKKRPYGYGNDNLREHTCMYKTEKHEKLEARTIFDRFHNAYLDELAMRGPLGLLAFLYIPFKLLRRKGSDHLTAVQAGIVGYLAEDIVGFGSVAADWTYYRLTGMGNVL